MSDSASLLDASATSPRSLPPAARPGPLAWGSAAAAGLVLGLAPLGLAWISEPVWWRGFAAVGAVIPALVWAGRRVPAWLTVPALWAVIAAAGVTEGWW
jgi:hypothetical protein